MVSSLICLLSFLSVGRHTQAQTSRAIRPDDIFRTTVFRADSVCYRIPALLCCPDSSLLVIAERRESWRDKSHTDVVVKRSQDQGKTWGDEMNLTVSANGGGYAFMDPCPILDPLTGKIFLFCTRWHRLDPDVTKNRAFMLVSEDFGKTWSKPFDISDSLLAPGTYMSGFGPGHGICIPEGPNKGRLVLITRQSDGTVPAGRTLYSDDHGETWSCGNPAVFGESQIAHLGGGRLYLNIRRGASRSYSFSEDGGITWSDPVLDEALPTLENGWKGCQASVLGTDNGLLFFCGPKGVPSTSTHDNRSGLTLFRSSSGTLYWNRRQELYPLASGYSDMALLPDGRLAILFEAGPEEGFIRGSGPRPPGWLRQDLLILPVEISDEGYWFE
ncbi:MAG: exo-alpha-sialidase [Bacteroidales bacterium]|nr:exo-alpha-sialidase [Bacteroidales bacterium]